MGTINEKKLKSYRNQNWKNTNIRRLKMSKISYRDQNWKNINLWGVKLKK